MRKDPPQSGFQKSLPALTVVSFSFIVTSFIPVVFTSYLYAANKAGAVIGREPQELSSGAFLKTGIAPDASWRKWGDVSGPGYDPLAGFKEINHAPALKARDLTEFAAQPEDDIITLDQKMTALDHMDKDGAAALEFCGQMQGGLDGAAQQYKMLNSALQLQDPLVYPSADAAGYFKEQKDYLRSLKTYIQNQELNQLGGARQYLSAAQGYQQKVLVDLRMTKTNLQKEEGYFRKAKIGGALRQQLNDKISGGKKDFIQHGGQDDRVPDPHKVPNKPPDPPVTVFFPDGRPPVKLKNAAEMKTFYEGEMGVKWPYPEPK